mgnify:CR=1 FL=1
MSFTVHCDFLLPLLRDFFFFFAFGNLYWTNYFEVHSFSTGHEWVHFLYVVAERISAERGENVGDTVGYKVPLVFLAPCNLNELMLIDGQFILCRMWFHRI